MKYYVTADVHAFYTLTVAALEEAGYFSDPEPHKLIICGDIMDRGPEPREMQEFIKDLIRKDEVILVRGNHEDLFCDLVDREEALPLKHHVHNGTYQTLLALTRSDPKVALAHPNALAIAGRITYFSRFIIPETVDYYETENYIFVHGWIPCYDDRHGLYSYYGDWREVGPATWDAARWVNGIEAAHAGVTEPGKTIVCGHWSASYGHSRYEGKGTVNGKDADYSPYYAPGIIALDACTAESGRVNVIVLSQ